MIEGNRISQAALYSVQRAFVAALQYKSELATYTDIDRNGKPTTVIETSAQWENIGNTPAIDVRMVFGSVQRNGELTEEEFIGLNLAETTLTTSAIAPKAVVESNMIRQREEWFLGKSSHDQHWFYWGWMVYKDIFPDTEIHVTELCWKIEEIKWKVAENGKHVGKPFFSAVPCVQHNCIDKFCGDYATIIHAAQSK